MKEKNNSFHISLHQKIYYFLMFLLQKKKEEEEETRHNCRETFMVMTNNKQRPRMK